MMDCKAQSRNQNNNKINIIIRKKKTKKKTQWKEEEEEEVCMRRHGIHRPRPNMKWSQPKRKETKTKDGTRGEYHFPSIETWM